MTDDELWTLLLRHTNGRMTTADAERLRAWVEADPARADVVFRAPEAPVIAGLLYAKVPLEALEAEAGLKVEGDPEVAKRYATLFELPEKIGRPAR